MLPSPRSTKNSSTFHSSTSSTPERYLLFRPRSTQPIPYNSLEMLASVTTAILDVAASRHPQPQISYATPTNDIMLLTGLVKLFTRSRPLTLAINILREKLAAKICNQSSQPTPMIVTPDKRVKITEANFQRFLEEIPDETLDLLYDDLVQFSNIILNLKLTKRSCKRSHSEIDSVSDTDSDQVVFTPPPPPPPTKRPIFKQAPTECRVTGCNHCGLKNTPEWRRGPDGSKTLCNACGLFFTKLSKRMGREEAARIMASRKRSGQSLNRTVPIRQIVPVKSMSVGSSTTQSHLKTNTKRMLE
ncbi:hypothetical protein CAAN1_12S00408 [[Candida] anglica]|uniref:GATA-type domain-containing protein n=1 Tax=[Candida] anglica TaxID=148631 RepID=A0ABP0E783_9ASCO